MCFSVASAVAVIAVVSLTAGSFVPSAHPGGGQHIWRLFLWSAAGIKADQRSFSPGDTHIIRIKYSYCSLWAAATIRTGSNITSTTFPLGFYRDLSLFFQDSPMQIYSIWLFWNDALFAAGAVQHDREPHQLQQPLQPVLHPELHAGSHDGPHRGQPTGLAAARLQ